MLDFDFMILNAIQTLRSDFLDVIMTVITYIGSTAFVWIIPGIALAVFKKTRKSGIVILLSIALVQIFGSGLIKHIVMRPRPFNMPQGLLTAADLIVSPPMGLYSFPSSHAGTAFAAAMSIFFINRKCGIWAFVLAALIGLSRLYLYVHFTTDVICGAALGVGCAFLARWLVRLLSDKFSKTL